MRISLCGYYGKNNFGDDMMATLLSEKFLKISILLSCFLIALMAPLIIEKLHF